VPFRECLTSRSPAAQTAEWPISTADAEGLDTVRLTAAVNRIRRGEIVSQAANSRAFGSFWNRYSFHATRTRGSGR
jgi:GDP-D-mannose dehydratase